MSIQNSTTHIDWIDGLKGLSALFVLLGHLNCAFRPIISTENYYDILRVAGFLGGRSVPIFIILSALIMTIKCNDCGQWKSILFKRYFRLMIPCAAVLCMYWMLTLGGCLYNNELAEVLNNDWLCSSIALSVKSCIKSILFSPWGGGQNYLNILWMMKYVFLSPFIIILLHIVMQSLYSMQKCLSIGIYILAFYYIDPFFICILFGYILGNLFKENEVENITSYKNRIVVLPLICTLLVVVVLYLPMLGNFAKGFQTTIESCLLVTIFCMSKYAKRLLSTRILLWIGKISFEVYLLHLLVIYTIACYAYIYFECRVLIIYSISICLTVAFAYLWNRYVNKNLNYLVNILVKMK